MKAKVISHTSSDVAPWWYKFRIGEVFEVYFDPKRDDYFYTKAEYRGKVQQMHIRKCDCELVES